jgi:2-deoxy-D-gluconate 3-dehydrogenase
MKNPLFDLTGKVAVVTGGNGGIGLGCAIALANAGADIAVWGRNESKNSAAVEKLKSLGVRAIGIQVDVTDRDAIDSATIETVSSLGGIDILFANAGVNLRKRPEEFSSMEWHKVMDGNITSVFDCAQAIYPEMIKRGGGKIVTIGSLTSIFGFGVSPVYAAAKGAVVQYSKSLASAWGKDNIQVNSILPGWIRTDMTQRGQNDEKFNRLVLEGTPAGRWGNPEDLAGAAVFLSSKASDFVTGTAIPIDGGFSSSLFILDSPPGSS